MKILYLDLGMGAAGDMLTAALLELLPDRDAFVEKLNSLGLPGVKYTAQSVQKCGITGTHMSVTVDGQEEYSEDFNMHGHDHEDEYEHHHNHHEDEQDIHHDHESEHDHHHDHEEEHDHDYDHEEEHGHHHDHEEEHDHHHNHESEHDHHHHGHHHSSMHDIEHIVCDHLNVPAKVKKDILAVYELIAEAESQAHGKPVSEIHFHEVGTMDAVADIAAVCMLINELSPDHIAASPVHVGCGHVSCAHGILPVPAPATAHILKDVPVYGGSIKGELCTPTGAALIKHFVGSFGQMPVMKTEAIGYGMGKKDFPAANCVRTMLGESEDEKDDIYELSCNVDDMPGEYISYAMDKLFEAGALDVFTVPVGMKKSRPGILIKVICHEDNRQEIVKTIFKYTTTIGIREQKMHRYILQRSIDNVETEYGTIRKKTVNGYGTRRSKYEYADISNAASAAGLSIPEIIEKIEN